LMVWRLGGGQNKGVLRGFFKENIWSFEVLSGIYVLCQKGPVRKWFLLIRYNYFHIFILLRKFRAQFNVHCAWQFAEHCKLTESFNLRHTLIISKTEK
jgi:hypothetical protein